MENLFGTINIIRFDSKILSKGTPVKITKRNDNNFEVYGFIYECTDSYVTINDLNNSYTISLKDYMNGIYILEPLTVESKNIKIHCAFKLCFHNINGICKSKTKEIHLVHEYDDSYTHLECLQCNNFERE